MDINVKKSSCLRVGPRHKVTCAEITKNDGNNLPWVIDIRHLGIFIVLRVSFSCSIDHTKCSFYRAAKQFLSRLVALPQRRRYWSRFLKNVYQFLLMDWRCVLYLKEYCSLLVLQSIVF